MQEAKSNNNSGNSRVNIISIDNSTLAAAGLVETPGIATLSAQQGFNN
jgi:hypothetical protein